MELRNVIMNTDINMDLVPVLEEWAKELGVSKEELLDTIVNVELSCHKNEPDSYNCFETKLRKVPLL